MRRSVTISYKSTEVLLPFSIEALITKMYWQVVWRQGFGYADLENNVYVGTAAIMRIGREIPKITCQLKGGKLIFLISGFCGYPAD